MKRVYPWAPVPWGVMVSGLESIPQDASHPARRWAARRDLWCAESDFPPGITWKPASLSAPGHQSGGTMLFHLAPLAAWQATFPYAPRPQALQVVNIDTGRPVLGRPEVDGGVSTHTYGPARGACFAMLDENSRALHVCESMASALKLRRYESGSVAVACDTTSLSECHTWGYIGCFRPIRLWINGGYGRSTGRVVGEAGFCKASHACLRHAFARWGRLRQRAAQGGRQP